MLFFMTARSGPTEGALTWFQKMRYARPGWQGKGKVEPAFLVSQCYGLYCPLGFPMALYSCTRNEY